MTASPLRAEPGGAPAVAVEGVTRRFGDFTAVDRVDLSVDPGEVVGLLGANGAGKTTLIRMLLGVLAPTSGRVHLFGEPPSRAQRRRIGYVPQNLGLYRDLTVRENLEFRAALFGTGGPTGEGGGPGAFAETRHRDGFLQTPSTGEGGNPGDVAETRHRDRFLQTGSSAGHVVGDLPLGLQRQAAFRAATQHDPDLLVLDEPTSGVSPLARSRLWNVIRERSDAGTAVLVSTHYMDEAEQADRIVMMANGRVVAEGSVPDIIGTRRVVEVTADDWPAALAAVEGDGRLVLLDGRVIRILGADQPAVDASLQRAGVTARTRIAPASLNETLVDLSRSRTG